MQIFPTQSPCHSESLCSLNPLDLLEQKPLASNYPLTVPLDNMAYVFAHRLKGCKFESHTG